MTYVSIDIETDGPIPGPYSMRSVGAVAYTRSGAELGRFYYKLLPLEGATMHAETMEFWQKFPKQWEEVNEDALPAAAVMNEMVRWLAPWKQPTAICWPAAWDFGWVYWYLIKFVGWSPFGHSAIDIKTMAGMYTGELSRRSSKKLLPADIKKQVSELAGAHTHVAVEDAAEQVEIFFALKRKWHGEK
jgi:hypothetical protein